MQYDEMLDGPSKLTDAAVQCDADFGAGNLAIPGENTAESATLVELESLEHAIAGMQELKMSLESRVGLEREKQLILRAVAHTKLERAGINCAALRQQLCCQGIEEESMRLQSVKQEVREGAAVAKLLKNEETVHRAAVHVSSQTEECVAMQREVLSMHQLHSELRHELKATLGELHEVTKHITENRECGPAGARSKNVVGKNDAKVLEH